MTACPDIETELTLEEAHLVLEPYFEAVQDRYVEAGLDRCERVRFFTANGLHDKPRHFAGCRVDGSVIMAAPHLAEQTESVVLAIMAHEFGHACDYLYPGQFAFGKDDEPAIRRDPESMKRKHWSAWLRDWKAREDDIVERSADAIAHYAMGVRYGYLGPCNIQSFDSIKARPYGLR